MPLRNGEHGYGLVTVALHWVTLLLMAGQLTLGYAMDADAAADRADERLDAREEACKSEDDAAEERCEAAVEREEDALDADDYAVLDGGFDPVDLHVVLGLAILTLGLARIIWRVRTPLPPWDERLTPLDRRVENLAERVLLGTQVVVPVSGLWLVLADDDALLPLHVAGHVLFYAVLLVHVGLVLRRGTLPRMLRPRPRGAAAVRDR